MEPLTKKQRLVLEFMEARLKENHPPSQREIADHFGLVQNAAYQLVGYLRKKGYLVDTGGHRGLRLSPEYLEERREVEGLPILGRVAAGTPSLAEQKIEGYLNVEKTFGSWRDGNFALRIRGDSMVDEGILDGDYVVIKAGPAVEDGQIAVVLLDDDATVKRVFFQGNRIALKPANRRARYTTRYIRAAEKNVRILGKVIGCIRATVK
ncbi:MAG: transcriptional repressor LexA [Planctomycetes bacterium]|jgi:repressor LexA|nr:transcriptional repressor LexA [Planctomycetota bacterium]